MRNALSITALGAVFLVGCSNKSPEGGSPGTNDTFKVVGPMTTTDIKQDNKQTVKMSIDRGKDFKKNVRLAVSGMPNDVKVILNKDVVAASDATEFTMDVDVGKNAPIGEHVLKVTGTPEGGGTPASVDVKIKVEKNP